MNRIVMNDNKHLNEEAAMIPPEQEALVDALLEEVYRPKAGALQNEMRIQALMQRIEVDNVEVNHVEVASVQGRPFFIRRFGRKRSLASIVIAATLLIAAGYFAIVQNSSNQAYAAVTLALEAKPNVRQYQLKMLNRRPISGQREIKSTLYFNDQDQFVLHRPSTSGFREIWVGGDRSSRWFIPPNGPALRGNETLMSGWLMKQDLLSPYLHMSTVLDTLRKNYKLKKLESVNFKSPRDSDSESTIRCTHVIGKSRSPRSRMPETIELWADEQTHIVHRLELKWNKSDKEPGPLTWTVELQNQPDLPSSWFELDGHLESNRRVIDVAKPGDLPSAEDSKR